MCGGVRAQALHGQHHRAGLCGSQKTLLKTTFPAIRRGSGAATLATHQISKTPKLAALSGNQAQPVCLTTIPLPCCNRWAAADAVEQVAGLPVALKWPNDLVIQSPIPNTQYPNWKKLAGILTETGVAGEQLDFAVVGIGINVNVPSETLTALDPSATSILAETGQVVDLAALLAALLAGVEARYEMLQMGNGPRAEWAARLATLGQRVEATTSAGVLAGVAESVDEDGALLLRAPNGKLHRLLAGDVTLSRL